MGALTYQGARVEFDDRLLTHLEVVIINKFRRGEGFVMSWARSVTLGSGRGSAWMVPTFPVFFTFEGSRLPAISDEWVRRLGASAESPRGLVVTNEDGSLAHEGAPMASAALRIVEPARAARPHRQPVGGR